MIDRILILLSLCCSQAIETLLMQVLPHVLKILPDEYHHDFMIHVVGANVVPEDLRKLIDKHKDYVTFHGYMPDDEVRLTRQAWQACADSPPS